MESGIKEQLKTLNSALKVGRAQISEVERSLRLDFDSLAITKEKETFLQNEAIYGFLKNFWLQYEFLMKKIEKEDEPSNFQFYIPLTRILLELYGELLYFVNQDNKHQMGVYTANYLLYLSTCYRFVSKDSKTIKDEYNRLMIMWNDVLSSNDIVYSEDIIKHTSKEVSRMGFKFPEYDQIFNKPYFTQQSRDTLACWSKEHPENFYNKYYRSYSNYTHPSFTNQMSGSTKTEIFWLIQFLFIIEQLMIELCDRKIFDGKFKNEYGMLARSIAETYPKLQNAWNLKRVSML